MLLRHLLMAIENLFERTTAFTNAQGNQGFHMLMITEGAHLHLPTTPIRLLQCTNVQARAHTPEYVIQLGLLEPGSF